MKIIVTYPPPPPHAVKLDAELLDIRAAAWEGMFENEETIWGLPVNEFRLETYKRCIHRGARNMENQHRKITGYRELDQVEIDMMNEIKQRGAELEALVEKLKDAPSTDKRWVAIGATDLQTGLMALVRSVAKPTTF